MTSSMDIIAAGLVCAAPGTSSETVQDILDGTPFFERHPTFIGHDGLPQTCGFVAGCAHELDPVKRLTHLLAQSYAQMVSGLPGDIAPEAKWALFLALPLWLDKIDGMRARFETSLASLDLVRVSRIAYRFGGAVAGISTFADAHKALDAGAADHVLVGGLDTLVAPTLLDARAMAGLANTRDNSYGAIPGEAGAILLVGRGPRRRLQRLACIQSVAVGYEPERLHDPNRGIMGKGLLTTIQTAQQLAGNPQANVLLSDFNGDRFRAEELGVVMSQLGQDTLYDPLCPASSIGEIGAATVAAYAALVAHAPDPAVKNALIAVSERAKERGALCMGPQA